jgi:hypothetical protein
MSAPPAVAGTLSLTSGRQCQSTAPTGGGSDLNTNEDFDVMSDEQTDTIAAKDDLDPVQAELAHAIIEALLDHTRVVSDLIAVMAQALDQDTTRALTQTAQWQSYLESRRKMERTREDVERFVKALSLPREPAS